MAVTILQIKQAIGAYLKQDKPEPNLVLQLGDSIEAEAMDYLKSIGAKQEKEFYVVSKEQAKEALFPPQIDWQAHWKNEEQRMKQKMKEGLKIA